jgi:glycosyltransferase involved in cell wall biosynthesis
MPYKVTLSMPIYNVEKYIEKAILSALNQTFESIEYILVDDKGADNSINIAREIIENHPRRKDVRIIEHKSNIGLGGVRNTAIDNAQGEFLYFMDSDDEITPDCISILYKAMMETPVNFVAASNEYIYLSYTKKKHTRSNFIYKDKFVKHDIFAVAKEYYLYSTSIAVYTWNKLYDLQFIKNNNIRCIPNHLNEDLYFTYQVILMAQSCRLLSDRTYLYYERKNSIVTKNDNGFTLRAGKQYDEIIRLKTIYSLKFKDCVFYSTLIRTNYIFAMDTGIRIYKSKKISLKEKYLYIKNVLKYPISFKEIFNLDDKIYFHIVIFLISKIPIITIKIFLFFCILKTMSLYGYIKRIGNNA